MIILSGVLVVVAIALLVAGIVAGEGTSAQVFGQDALNVIYVSIGVSIVSLLCLIIGVVLRRGELFGSGAATAAARKRQAKKKDAKAGRRAPAKADDTAGDGDDEGLPLPAQPLEVPSDAVVHVVRGRRRYHLDTCRQLAGREADELTYAEAREEGFSPCTACMPDTALAARAAVSVPAAPAAERDAVADSGSGGGLGTSPGTGDGPVGDAGGNAPSPAPVDPGLTAPLPSRSEPAPAPVAPAYEEPAAAPADEPAAPSSDTGWSAATSLSKAPAHTDEPRVDPLADPLGGPAAEAPLEAPAPGPLPSAWPAPGGSLPSEPADAEPYAAEEPPVRPTLTDTPAEPPAAPRPRASEPAETPQDTPVLGHEPAAADPLTDPLAALPTTGSYSTDSFGTDSYGTDSYGSGSSGTGSAGTASSGGTADDEQVRILSGTKRYHRVDCALIEDIGDEADDLESLPRAEAKARGCTPCLVCQPDREHARD
ncbi:hypothetical protein [Actinomadura atramentaria]|uniref:hypothetical protein n=1 Tax=Actinomadura atramentaria TaxID=1990 RepID=UPI0003A8D948|nr:hypothetical protein [Actinomadura atramentaria]